MIKAIVTAFVLGVLVLGIWAGSDFWSATSKVPTETIGELENAVFHVTGMT